MTQASYDFNTTFGKLPYYDQGGTGACYTYSKCLAVTALFYAASDDLLIWNQAPGNPPPLTYNNNGHEFGIGGWFETTIAGVPLHFYVDNIGFDPTEVDFDTQLKDLVDEKKVIVIATDFPASLTNYNNVFEPLINDNVPVNYNTGHGMVVVGYTPEGLIIQNSWGSSWGHKGRAILSWNWLKRHLLQIEVIRPKNFDVSNLDSVATQNPAPRNEVFVVRRMGPSAAYAVHGTTRSPLPTMAAVNSIGKTADDIIKLPDDHIFWTFPLLHKPNANFY